MNKIKFILLMLLFILGSWFFWSHVKLVDASTIVFKTIAYEAGGESIYGQYLVATVIRVRMQERNIDADAVCLQPWQFSCWNPKEKRRILTKKELENAKIAWEESINSDLKINLYHTEDILPYWVKSNKVKFVLKEGSHLFYYESR